MRVSMHLNADKSYENWETKGNKIGLRSWGVNEKLRVKVKCLTKEGKHLLV